MYFSLAMMMKNNECKERQNKAREEESAYIHNNDPGDNEWWSNMQEQFKMSAELSCLFHSKTNCFREHLKRAEFFEMQSEWDTYALKTVTVVLWS